MSMINLFLFLCVFFLGNVVENIYMGRFGILLYTKTLNIEGIINHRTCKRVLSLRIDKEEESNLLFLWKEKQEHGQF